RSQVRTIASILSGELIAKSVDIYFELVCDHIPRSRRVILRVVSRPRIGSSMRQLLIETELLCKKSPVLIEPFKFSNEIGEHISIGVDKPIKLITVRRGMNASGAAVLDPIDKFFESHFVSELQSFRALIQ